MKSIISSGVKDSIDAVGQLLSASSVTFIENVSLAIAECFRRGNKIIIAGNGGSLCDAAHFAEELTGQFRCYRKALPAIALTDPGHITCTANDMGFDFVFSRGVEAYGVAGDIFVGLTTSGNSPNIINAFKAARKLSMISVAFLGKGGGVLQGFADHELIISGFPTSDRIQEAHMTAIHIIIEIVEDILFTGRSVSGLKDNDDVVGTTATT